MDECSKIHTRIWDLDFYKTNLSLRGQKVLIIDIKRYGGEASRETSVESRGQNHGWQNDEVMGEESSRAKKSDHCQRCWLK
jgi:hypothetical protein